MNTALWILAGVLSAAFLVGGVSQLVMPIQRFRAIGPATQWAEDFTPGHLKAIGTIKVLGAAGLILPTLFDVAPQLVPVAACGLMLVMAGAGTIRFRRCEWRFLAGDLLYLSLFALLAWGRFAIEPFA